MKKIVLKVDLHDNKEKQKALKSVSTFSGIDSIAMDMKEKKMMVIGTVDPVTIVSKLRKYWPTTNILSVGPAKEPEKKEEPKKDGETPKKEEDAKKDAAAGEAKKDGAAGEAKKEEGEAKKEEGEAKKDEGEAKKDEGEAKKDGGGEKKDTQPAAAQPQPQPQPHPIQLIPQFQHLPMPYPQPYPHPYPYPYPQPQSDPRIMEHVKGYNYRAHNPQPQYTTHYHVQSMEENPNACVIC